MVKRGRNKKAGNIGQHASKKFSFDAEQTPAEAASNLSIHPALQKLDTVVTSSLAFSYLVENWDVFEQGAGYADCELLASIFDKNDLALAADLLARERGSCYHLSLELQELNSALVTMRTSSFPPKSRGTAVIHAFRPYLLLDRLISLKRKDAAPEEGRPRPMQKPTFNAPNRKVRAALQKSYSGHLRAIWETGSILPEIQGGGSDDTTVDVPQQAPAELLLQHCARSRRLAQLNTAEYRMYGMAIIVNLFLEGCFSDYQITERAKKLYLAQSRPTSSAAEWQELLLDGATWLAMALLTSLKDTLIFTHCDPPSTDFLLYLGHGQREAREPQFDPLEKKLWSYLFKMGRLEDPKGLASGQSFQKFLGELGDMLDLKRTTEAVKYLVPDVQEPKPFPSQDLYKFPQLCVEAPPSQSDSQEPDPESQEPDPESQPPQGDETVAGTSSKKRPRSDSLRGAGTEAQGAEELSQQAKRLRIEEPDLDRMDEDSTIEFPIPYKLISGGSQVAGSSAGASSSAMPGPPSQQELLQEWTLEPSAYESYLSTYVCGLSPSQYEELVVVAEAFSDPHRGLDADTFRSALSQVMDENSIDFRTWSLWVFLVLQGISQYFINPLLGFEAPQMPPGPRATTRAPAQTPVHFEENRNRSRSLSPPLRGVGGSPKAPPPPRSPIPSAFAAGFDGERSPASHPQRNDYVCRLTRSQYESVVAVAKECINLDNSGVSFPELKNALLKVTTESSPDFKNWAAWADVVAERVKEFERLDDDDPRAQDFKLSDEFPPGPEAYKCGLTVSGYQSVVAAAKELQDAESLTGIPQFDSALLEVTDVGSADYAEWSGWSQKIMGHLESMKEWEESGASLSTMPVAEKMPIGPPDSSADVDMNGSNASDGEEEVINLATKDARDRKGKGRAGDVVSLPPPPANQQRNLRPRTGRKNQGIQRSDNEEDTGLSSGASKHGNKADGTNTTSTKPYGTRDQARVQYSSSDFAPSAHTHRPKTQRKRALPGMAVLVKHDPYAVWEDTKPQVVEVARTEKEKGDAGGQEIQQEDESDESDDMDDIDDSDEGVENVDDDSDGDDEEQDEGDLGNTDEAKAAKEVARAAKRAERKEAKEAKRAAKAAKRAERAEKKAKEAEEAAKDPKKAAEKAAMKAAMLEKAKEDAKKPPTRKLSHYKTPPQKEMDPISIKFEGTTVNVRSWYKRDHEQLLKFKRVMQKPKVWGEMKKKIVHEYTHEEFTEKDDNGDWKLSGVEIKKKLAEKHILVRGGEPLISVAELDRRLVLKREIQVQDLYHRQTNVVGCHSIGSLQKMKEIGDKDKDRPMNALTLPGGHLYLEVPRLLETSFVDTVWHALRAVNRPTYEESIPMDEFRWALYSTKNSYSTPHIDSNGLLTVISPVDSEKIWILGQHKHNVAMDARAYDKFGMYARIEDHDWVPVWLKPGDLLYMKPGTPHAVLTVKSGYTVGEHFFTDASMADSLAANFHICVWNPFVTNAQHNLAVAKTWVRFLHCWKMRQDVSLEEDDIPSIDFTDKEQIRNLVMLGAYLFICPWIEEQERGMSSADMDQVDEGFRDYRSVYGYFAANYEVKGIKDKDFKFSALADSEPDIEDMLDNGTKGKPPVVPLKEQRRRLSIIRRIFRNGEFWILANLTVAFNLQTKNNTTDELERSKANLAVVIEKLLGIHQLEVDWFEEIVSWLTEHHETARLDDWLQWDKLQITKLKL